MIVSHLESIKKYLKIYVKRDGKIINFDEDTSLGQLLYQILKKIGCDKKTWKANMDLFMVDFRNAISHQHYLITKEGITIYHNDETKKQFLCIDDLYDVTLDVTGIYNAFGEFGEEMMKKLHIETDGSS